MNRREAIKRIGLTMGCALSSSVITGVLSGCKSAYRSDYQHMTMNDDQDHMVIILTELIIPATDTPGAKAAKVNQFIDLMLTKWLHDKEKEKFLTGLDRLNKRSKESFDKSFVDIATANQIELLEVLEKESRTENRDEAFFPLLKQLTITGYYTSEIGASKELKVVKVPGYYDGDVPYDKIGRAWGAAF